MSAAAPAKTLQITVEPDWRQAVEARLTRYPSRKEWLEGRASGIGGSEVAIVMGASNWGSPYSLWAKKTGLDNAEMEDSEVLEFGRLAEPLIAKKYQEKTGRKLIDLGQQTVRRHHCLDFLYVTHDYLIEPVRGHDGPGVLSIKCVNPWAGDEWSEASAPLKYEVQLQAELAASGFKWGSFAFLAWGQPVQWFDRERNDAFIEAMEAECVDFWRRVKEGDPPPVDGSDSTTAALRRLHPKDSGATIVLPPEAADWAEELDRLSAEIKERETRKEAIHNQLRALLGDATEGVVPGGPAWTYRVEGAKPAASIAAMEVPAFPGYRVLRRKGKPGGKKKGGK